MLAASVFFLAPAFNVRTSTVDHERRFDFLAIKESPDEDEDLCSMG
jgi:hypothetical protein